MLLRSGETGVLLYYCGKQLDSPPKVHHRIIMLIQPLHPYLPKEPKARTQRYLYSVKAALFTTDKRWKQPKCLFATDWLNKICNRHTVDYKSSLNMKAFYPCYNMNELWKHVKCNKPGTKRLTFVWFHLSETLRMGLLGISKGTEPKAWIYITWALLGWFIWCVWGDPAMAVYTLESLFRPGYLHSPSMAPEAKVSWRTTVFSLWWKAVEVVFCHDWRLL